MSAAIFFRLLTHDDKGAALADTVTALRDGDESPHVFAVEPESFEQVPGSPFAYWVSDNLRGKFTAFPQLQSSDARVCIGLSTKDDFRFLRLTWEVAPVSAAVCWFSFVKGGEFSTFYADPYFLIDWEENGLRLKQFADQRTKELFGVASWSRWINSWEYYFRPGLTWTRRTSSRFGPRVMPSACIFADKGPSGFVKHDNHAEILALIALMNSLPFAALVAVQLGAVDTAARSYEVGIIQRTPLPNLSNPYGKELSELSLASVNLKRNLDTINETSHVFHLPALMQVGGETLVNRIGAWQARVAETQRQLEAHQREIDEIAFALYGIQGEDRRAIEDSLNHRDTEAQSTDEDEEEPSLSLGASVVNPSPALVQYVEPKLRLEADRLQTLRQQRQQFGASGKQARQAEKALAKQEALVADVQEFRDRLERAAKLYLTPDLNDGVVLTIAPLWELVPWKEAKTYWNELLAGKYEWSSIGKQLRQKRLV